MKLVRTVRVDKPIETVYAYLSDFTNTTEWDPGTVKTTRVSGDGGVGTTYANTSRFAGRRTQLTYVTTELSSPTRIVLRGENTTVVATDQMELRSVGSGTEVTYTAEFAFNGIAKHLTPLLKAPIRKLGDEAAEGMRNALNRL